MRCTGAQRVRPGDHGPSRRPKLALSLGGQRDQARARRWRWWRWRRRDVAADLFPRVRRATRREQVDACGAALIGSPGFGSFCHVAQGMGRSTAARPPTPLRPKQRRSLFPSLTIQTNRRVLPTATLQRQELRQDQTPLSAIIWRYTTVASSSSTTGVISISQ